MDANVCVSAVLSAKGSPARILDHALEEGPHDFELYAPSQLFPKVEEVLARPKIADRLRWGPAEIGAYTRRLRLAITEISTHGLKIPQYTGDPKDDPHVLAAVLAGASYLLSGDDDILKMEDSPVPVLGPSQFLRLWEAQLL